MTKKKEIERLIARYRADIAALEEREEHFMRRIEIYQNILPTVLVWYMWKVSQSSQEVPFPQHETEQEAKIKMEHLESVLIELQQADQLLKEEEQLMRNRIDELEKSIRPTNQSEELVTKIIGIEKPRTEKLSILDATNKNKSKENSFEFDDQIMTSEMLPTAVDNDWKTICNDLTKQASELTHELKNSLQKLKESEDYIKNLENKSSTLEKELEDKIKLLEQIKVRPASVLELAVNSQELENILQNERESKKSLPEVREALAEIISMKEALSKSSTLNKDIHLEPLDEDTNAQDSTSLSSGTSKKPRTVESVSVLLPEEEIIPGIDKMSSKLSPPKSLIHESKLLLIPEVPASSELVAVTKSESTKLEITLPVESGVKDTTLKRPSTTDSQGTFQSTIKPSVSETVPVVSSMKVVPKVSDSSFTKPQYPDRSSSANSLISPSISKVAILNQVGSKISMQVTPYIPGGSSVSKDEIYIAEDQMNYQTISKKPPETHKDEIPTSGEKTTPIVPQLTPKSGSLAASQLLLDKYRQSEPSIGPKTIVTTAEVIPRDVTVEPPVTEMQNVNISKDAVLDIAQTDITVDPEINKSLTDEGSGVPSSVIITKESIPELEKHQMPVDKPILPGDSQDVIKPVSKELLPISTVDEFPLKEPSVASGSEPIPTSEVLSITKLSVVSRKTSLLKDTTLSFDHEERHSSKVKDDSLNHNITANHVGLIEITVDSNDFSTIKETPQPDIALKSTSFLDDYNISPELVVKEMFLDSPSHVPANSESLLSKSPVLSEILPETSKLSPEKNQIKSKPSTSEAPVIKVLKDLNSRDEVPTESSHVKKVTLVSVKDITEGERSISQPKAEVSKYVIPKEPESILGDDYIKRPSAQLQEIDKNHKADLTLPTKRITENLESQPEIPTISGKPTHTPESPVIQTDKVVSERSFVPVSNEFLSKTAEDRIQLKESPEMSPRNEQSSVNLSDNTSPIKIKSYEEYLNKDISIDSTKVKSDVSYSLKSESQLENLAPSVRNTIVDKEKDNILIDSAKVKSDISNSLKAESQLENNTIVEKEKDNISIDSTKVKSDVSYSLKPESQLENLAPSVHNTIVDKEKDNILIDSAKVKSDISYSLKPESQLENNTIVEKEKDNILIDSIKVKSDVSYSLKPEPQLENLAPSVHNTIVDKEKDNILIDSTKVKSDISYSLKPEPQLENLAPSVHNTIVDKEKDNILIDSTKVKSDVSYSLKPEPQLENLAPSVHNTIVDKEKDNILIDSTKVKSDVSYSLKPEPQLENLVPSVHNTIVDKEKDNILIDSAKVKSDISYSLKPESQLQNNTIVEKEKNSEDVAVKAEIFTKPSLTIKSVHSISAADGPEGQAIVSEPKSMESLPSGITPKTTSQASGLQKKQNLPGHVTSLAVQTLQGKVRVKDHIIKSLADHLRELARSNVWAGSKTLEAAANTSPTKTYDFDRNTLLLYIKGEEPENYVPSMQDDKYSNSNPLGLRIVQKLDNDSLLIKWERPLSAEVVGFQIFLNGHFMYWVHSDKRNLALLHPLDLRLLLEITVSGIDARGGVVSQSTTLYKPQ